MSQILGITFFNESEFKLFDLLNNLGGLLTVPSGPGIATIPDEQKYYESLLNSDLVIADSGLMVLVWNMISKEKVKRISGLKFINSFLDFYPKTDLTKKVFLVNPSQKEQNVNINYLNSVNVPISESFCHLAPYYSKKKIEDLDLLQKLNSLQPHWVFLNIGGGTQEILGYWLKNNLNYKPAIICTGAAIAFKTGYQVKIPTIIDELYLGWLWRTISNPKVYGKRFWEARKTVSLILNYREKKVEN